MKMIEFAYFTAFWLGILTAISPCPLATNIAAISFIGKHVHRRKRVFLSGLSYTIGRTFTYVFLGVAISSGLFALDQVSRFLQKYMNEIIGPAMILLGMILLGLIGSAVSFNLVGEKNETKSGDWESFLGFRDRNIVCAVILSCFGCSFFCGSNSVIIQSRIENCRSRYIWDRNRVASAFLRNSHCIQRKIRWDGF